MDILVAAFSPIYKKVKFTSDEMALRAYAVLSRSGSWVEELGDNKYGLSCERQVRMLRKAKILFTFID